jgi:hypothetical protein
MWAVERLAAAAQKIHRIFIIIAERVGGWYTRTRKRRWYSIAYDNFIRSGVKDGPTNAMWGHSQEQERGWGMNVLTSFVVEEGVRGSGYLLRN